MMKLIHLYILVFLALGCSKTNSPIESSQTGEGALLRNQTINSSGKERAYHLYLPKKLGNAPVVVLLHGNKGSHNQLLGLNGKKAPYKVWLEVAEKENLILVVPNGTKGSNGSNGWNDCRTDAEGNSDSNDVLFIDELIDYVVSEYGTKSTKVFAVGTSNGGHMAMRLAQEIPSKLTGFASIVAAKPVHSDCVNTTIPISALIMNGTEDPIVPFEGGQMLGNRGEVFSADETIDYWVTRNQTDLQPVVTDLPNTNKRDNSTVQKKLYSNGASNTEVAFYKVIGGGHTGPSISERHRNAYKWIVKEQNGDIELAYEVWDFFKTK